MKLNILQITLCASLFTTQAIAINAGSVGVGYMEDTVQVAADLGDHGARPCPAFCVNPYTLAEGVDTVAEMEVLAFMDSESSDEEGLLVDTRPRTAYQQGTIPGSINLPFSILERSAENRELATVLQSLGVRERGEVGFFQRSLEQLGLFGGDVKTEKWDFSEAKELVLWCDDASCEHSPRAIQALVELGYPVDRLKYYRGGFKIWQALGLTIEEPALADRVARK